jgi:4-oxalocrotonate tautomerase
MPYINVRITEGATQAQKEEVIRRITDVMTDVLGKNPNTTFVIIDEVAFENWGMRGESIQALKQKGKY